MPTAAHGPYAPQLPHQLREQFLARTLQALQKLHTELLQRYSALLDTSGTTRQQQDRRDAWVAYQKLGPVWQTACEQAWHQATPAAQAQHSDPALDFELLGDDVVEDKILSSRLTLSLQDKVSWEFNDLRVRMQALEAHEMPDEDALRPSNLAQIMVEQWSKVGLLRAYWSLAQETLESSFAAEMLDVYRACNLWLIQQGVMPEIDLRSKLKRNASPAATSTGGAAESTPTGETPSTQATQSSHSSSGGGGGAGAGAGIRSYGASGGGGTRGGAGGAATGAGPTGPATSYEPTHLMAAGVPVAAHAGVRAQGVMGQLKTFITSQIADFTYPHAQVISAPLAEAMTQVYVLETGSAPDATPQQRLAQARGELHDKTHALKTHAQTESEKAIIEIVALMFQSILTEERLPANVRVWFARLQIPLLRVALSEPDFFESLQHPARVLIDRMGSCVLGFEASSINAQALEKEVQRIVQVIEQYPDTGTRVFEIVLEEFKQFLAKFLTQDNHVQRVVSVAQQMEEKETLVIQYTIELRKMLDQMAVPASARNFLFKVWAEVLAVASMKNGPQHAQTIEMKSVAADLVWVLSAKPNRAERAKVIQAFPQLQHRLRLGMSLLGFDSTVQEQHLKSISDTLMDAFMSKTAVIDRQDIDRMAKRLVHLEDFISEEGVSDLPLDAAALELMIGIEAAHLEVITDGGAPPHEAVLAWAQELLLGTWYQLDHNGQLADVQYVWHSPRKQLHLFAAARQHNYLLQAGRLAAYLQAGLLVPTEEEVLTIRATRQAMAKLQANPERLLASGKA